MGKPEEFKVIQVTGLDQGKEIVLVRKSAADKLAEAHEIAINTLSG